MIWTNNPLDEIYSSFKMPQLNTVLTDTQCMDIAYQIAWQGCGSVSTNPLVGAVAVDSKQSFLKAAAHLQRGKAHAEVNLVEALKRDQLLSRLKGGCIYVTLEPCCHTGLTPPCTSLLKNLAPISVKYGCKDPNPLVAGRGISELLKADIKVSQIKTTGLTKLLEHFQWYLKNRRPFVGIKVATSLNGIIAKTGDSRNWITGERARSYGHWLRLHYDSILIGANTLIQDNPSLNIRYLKDKRTPLRIVLDPNAKALLSRPIDLNNLIKIEPQKTIWCMYNHAWNNVPKHTRYKLESYGVQKLHLYKKSKSDVIEQILEHLGSIGCVSMLVEGGGFTWRKFLDAQKVNKVHLFQSPQIFGGDDNIHWTDKLEKHKFKLKNIELSKLGEDLLIEGSL